MSPTRSNHVFNLINNLHFSSINIIITSETGDDIPTIDSHYDWPSTSKRYLQKYDRDVGLTTSTRNSFYPDH